MEQIVIRATKYYNNHNTAIEEQRGSNEYYDEDYDVPDKTTERDVDLLILSHYSEPVLGDFIYHMEEDYDELWKGWYYGEIVYIKPN